MIETYKSRVIALRKEMGLSETKLQEKLKSALSENGAPEASAFQLAAWTATPSVTFSALPPVSALPYIANVLETNIGYLFGLNEVREMTNDRLTLAIDIETCAEEYKQKHGGNSIWKDGVVHNQWYLNVKRKENKKLFIKPFIELSKALDWDVDYILGLSDVKHWQYYCLTHQLLDRLPEGTRFLLDDKKTIATLGANGNFDVLKDGLSLQIDLEQMLKRDPKIICGYELLD